MRGARVELPAARRALLHRYLLRAKVVAAEPLPNPFAGRTPEERAAQLGLQRINAPLLPMVLVSDSFPEGERPGHHLTTYWLEGARFTCEATDTQVDTILPNNLKVCCLPIIRINCKLSASGSDAVPFWGNAGLILKQTGASTYEYQRVGFWEKSTTECDEADSGISDADHETFMIVSAMPLIVRAAWRRERGWDCSKRRDGDMRNASRGIALLCYTCLENEDIIDLITDISCFDKKNNVNAFCLDPSFQLP